MSYKLLIPKLLENRRLIIGLGSGRCGTTSLAHLLNIQEDSDVTHEYHVEGIFNLLEDSVHSLALFCLIDILGREAKVVGDVSYYWLRYAKILTSFSGDVRFICLQRDKEATIESFMKSPVQIKSPMSQYTKSDFSRHYDEYYMWVNYYAERHPDKFRLFDIEALNTEEGQRSVLNFAGFSTHSYDIGVKLNSREESGV